MCLGLPGQIISISGTSAVMECWGDRKTVRIESLAETLLPGDYVIEHEGIIVRLIPPDEVADTLTLYETILSETLVPA